MGFDLNGYIDRVVLPYRVLATVKLKATAKRPEQLQAMLMIRQHPNVIYFTPDINLMDRDDWGSITKISEDSKIQTYLILGQPGFYCQIPQALKQQLNSIDLLSLYRDDYLTETVAKLLLGQPENTPDNQAYDWSKKRTNTSILEANAAAILGIYRGICDDNPDAQKLAYLLKPESMGATIEFSEDQEANLVEYAKEIGIPVTPTPVLQGYKDPLPAGEGRQDVEVDVIIKQQAEKPLYRLSKTQRKEVVLSKDNYDALLCIYSDPSFARLGYELTSSESELIKRIIPQAKRVSSQVLDRFVAALFQADLIKYQEDTLKQTES